jgi:hypothetical protein
MKYYLIHDDRRGKPVQIIAIPLGSAGEFEELMNNNPRLRFEILTGYNGVFNIVGALMELAEAQDDD